MLGLFPSLVLTLWSVCSFLHGDVAEDAPEDSTVLRQVGHFCSGLRGADCSLWEVPSGHGVGHFIGSERFLSPRFSGALRGRGFPLEVFQLITVLMSLFRYFR